jgi:hypothetical protein
MHMPNPRSTRYRHSIRMIPPSPGILLPRNRVAPLGP